MSITPPTAPDFARSRSRRRRRDRDFLVRSGPPLRGELLGIDQMEELARELARRHHTYPDKRRSPLLQRLRENERTIESATAYLGAMVHDDLRITPAGEWLLDNAYLIEENTRLARRHLPRGYTRELPVLSEGDSAGLPRVYDLVLHVVAHGDGRIDAESLTRFVAAYQSTAVLTLGELWAIPGMLRLALIENLRRMAESVLRDGAEHRLAREWGQRLVATAERAPRDVVLDVADLARSDPPASGAFIAELMRLVQGRSAALALPVNWIEHWLEETGHSADALVRAETRQQATDQVSVGNSIGSLRFLAHMDWREFVETLSAVESVLRQDPAGTYARMDFATRDAYRHAVEAIARRADVAESMVARAALALAQAQHEDPILGHVGYFLVDDGEAALCDALSEGRAARRVRARSRRTRLPTYLLPILVLASAFASGLLAEWPRVSAAELIILGAVALLAFSDLGIAMVNWAATVLVPPRPLPRLDFSEGLPSGARTLVVVPTMLGRLDGVDALLEGLEVRFLANRDEYLHFALLTDFLDADERSLATDEALLAHAVAGIEQLNARYAPERLDRFFLMHRAREWNDGEATWMARERKRGKLAALNRLLLGADGADADFTRVVGNTGVLGNVRYVITLDTDTRLPRDAAREFVGTLAHPLNQARLDPARGCVVRGYGILQPSVGSSMSGRAASRYASLFGSEPGIDPYTRTISDVYQDLFGEGSFVGKGIYDVAAFEAALADRFPENSILSHDLLEGCHARAGLVSDVRLFEDHPSRYAADVKRRYRWIRGDWQLLPWIGPWVPRAGGGWQRNPLSWLSRGKLLDNLRRSLVPIATLALLLAGWSVLPDPFAWTLWLLTPWLVPIVLRACWDLATPPTDLPWSSHLRQVARAASHQLRQAAVELACLPHEAFYSLDAIVRTLWRVAVSRRHLLQWNPSSEVERALGRGAQAELSEMAPSTLAILGATLGVAIVNPDALWIVAAFILAWVSAPWLMAWLGQSPALPPAAISASQRNFLGRLARRTWAFFETYVRAEDHWLPPDNVQEHPVLVVARRTSPTNIGLSLLANLSAWDLGYAQPTQVMRRTAATLATLETLPRYRGHFFNWYDTANLAPLSPRYVSSVDSGNLAGHLLTLRQGLRALADAPVLATHTFDGLADTLGVIEEEARLHAVSDALRREVAATRDELASVESSPSLISARSALAGLAQRGSALRAAWLDAAPRADTLWCDAFIAGCVEALEEVEAWLRETEPAPDAALPTLRQLSLEVGARGERARSRIHELERLAHVAGQLSLMDHRFLYDRGKHLLSIGYNVDERRLDPGRYDLLASEARLGVFVAIAQGQLPQESWFALSRLLTVVEGHATLLSWSGSMFEYLMPMLVMPSYPGTLIDHASRNAVTAQIRYGERRGVPWGISESGYNTVDAHSNYQYRAFGVPGLGLKRGLGQDLVIAPYATMMALMVEPRAACENLQRLAAAGFDGRFGLHEAIDFTPSRLQLGSEFAVVRSFMAHHQGMGLLGLVHLLRDQPMQRRFVSDPEFQATLLLLQERVPRVGVIQAHEAEEPGSRPALAASETRLRVFRDPGAPRAAVQLLSNGRYHAMLTSAGGGYSRRHDLALTRWREDATRDAHGIFCYLADVESRDLWSASHQPTCEPVEQYEAIFSDAKAEFRGRRQGIESHLEVTVSPEDDVELRRLRVTNRSRRERTIEVTTYAEVVLAPSIADEAHPAFSNLFVQTELVREKQALLCTRRARSHSEVPPWLLHLVAVHDADIEHISYETDRARFLGRGGTPRRPRALAGEAALSDSVGSVLDPIVSIRSRIRLQPEQTATIDMVFGTMPTRDDAALLIEKYRDRRLADRAFDLAWTHSQVVRRQINASQSDAQLYERMASLIVHAHALLRAEPAVLLQNRRGQPGLWGHAISGDLPIVLVQIADAANIELVRQMVQAHAYWRLKGLKVDLVIWNEDQAGYRQLLQDQILGLVSAGPDGHALDRPGGVFVRPAHQLSHEDRLLQQSVARLIVSDQRGPLATQIGRTEPSVPEIARLPVARDAAAGGPAVTPAWPFPDRGPLAFDNGLGGFSADGREYVIGLEQDEVTPAPWCNVLSNAQFGSVVSESSPGYTWAENAHEFRLTPWHNDPVSDTGGEAYYLRDEDTGRIWSPTPWPARGRGRYCIRHGFGYSIYEHVEDGIATELTLFVAQHQPVKFARLVVRNLSGRPRRLTATGFVEWVLGDLRGRGHMHIVTERDAASGLLTARNPYNTDFAGRVAFFDVDAAAPGVSGDRREFIGRNGSLAAPAALRRERLSGRVGAALDPCAALQVPIALADGARFETSFRLGVATDARAAIALAQRLRGTAATRDALEAVHVHWRDTLDAVRVETPDPSLDLLVNGWLPYQILACRFHARSGFYQSGGAFGFRDQLQDTMALLHAAPELARAHLLASAAHQFPQGDVMHWWHPPQGRGVRTRCSDDFLWLPLAAARYVEVTGDERVLDAMVGFVEGRAVAADEEAYYDLPVASSVQASLYEHCVLAVRRAAGLLGARGLPLIGSGDWNDGMNRVGDAGRGESVWLGFFLFDVLVRFGELARSRDDGDMAAFCAEAANRLRASLEAHAWDGDWYRRAWFDDGSPLGSKASDECRIDSISQSWAVLSGAAPPELAARAMASLDATLVRRDAGLILLLDPPFDRTAQDPGYIRGYVPGVRENGGQYTHAAVWAAMAFAHQGDTARAWELASMINPIHHALDRDAAWVYKAEPYVLAADVYGVAPHVGRGGWTWYTGSAGWMYRLFTESLLGVARRGERLQLRPQLPAHWNGFRLEYRYGTARYRIEVQVDETLAASAIDLDGRSLPCGDLPLADDAATHEVRWRLPRAPVR